MVREPPDATPTAEDVLAAALSATAEFGPVELDALCRARPALEAELRRCFAGVVNARALLDSARRRVEGTSAALADCSPDPERYDVLGEIGRGGMSAVLEVFDRHLQRRMALKCMLHRPGEPEASPRALERERARLVNEARVLARLEHPAIVPVHDVGRDLHGEVYFTMLLVRGIDLRAALRAARAGADDWSLVRVVGALQRAAEALTYVHEQRIVHRDIKPANVMVGPFGETYVLDFGLARSLDDVTAERDPVPTGGASAIDGDGVVGTPAYMAPEQARGESPGVAGQADVYSVGAILYELLTGQAPYTSRGTTSRPSEVLARLRAGPPTGLRAHAPRAPRELAAICERAMEREPVRRYPSMRALADDLRAYLEGRVVRASRVGPLVEMSKWVARNRLSAAALLTILIGALVFGFAQRHQARALATTVEDLDVTLYRSQVGLAAASLRIGDVGEARALLDATRQDLRGWEWRELDARFRDFRWSASTGVAWSHVCCISADGQRVAVGGGPPCFVQVFDVATGALVAATEVKDVVSGLAFDAAGEALFVLVRPCEILVLDALTLADTGERRFAEVAAVHRGRRVHSLAHSLDRSRLFTGGSDGRAGIWDADSGACVRFIDSGNSVVRIALTDDASLLVTMPHEGPYRVWEAGTGELVQKLHFHGVQHTGFAFEPGTARAVMGDSEGRIVLIDSRTGDIERPAGVASGAVSLSWSRSLPTAVASFGPFLRLYDTTRWSLLDQVVGHQQLLLVMQLSDDGRVLVTADLQGIVRCWDLEELTRKRTLAQRLGQYERLLFDAASRELVVVWDNGHVDVWDVNERRISRSFDLPANALRDAELAVGGGWLATVDAAGLVCVADLATGAVIARFRSSQGRYDQCSLGRGAGVVYLATSDGTLTALDRETGAPRWAPLESQLKITSMKLAPDGRRLVLAAKSPMVTVVDAAQGVIERSCALVDDAFIIHDIDASGDQALVRGTSTGVYLLDLARGSTVWRQDSSGNLGSAAFDARGDRVFTASVLGDLVLVDRASGTRIANVPGHSSGILLVAASPDGATVATVALDGSLRLWGASSIAADFNPPK